VNELVFLDDMPQFGCGYRRSLALALPLDIRFECKKYLERGRSVKESEHEAI
jgi:hypothetical protein